MSILKEFRKPKKYLVGGKLSFLWWRNKTIHAIQISNAQANRDLIDCMDHCCINQTVKKLHENCKGRWRVTTEISVVPTITVNAKGLFTNTTSAVAIINFSNKSDATFFKLLWG